MRVRLQRRAFLMLLGGAAVASPLVARAQDVDGRLRTVGVLTGYADTDPEGLARVDAFRGRMRELGWIEGRNIKFELRWVAAAGTDHLQRAAGEIVRASPDAIVANGARATTALLEHTRSVPIVFAVITDPVKQGFVQSLARPGGNVTGFSQFEFMAGKLLEIFKEAAPHLKQVAYAHSPTLVGADNDVRGLSALAPSLGLEAVALPVRDGSDIERAFTSFAAGQNRGVIVAPDAVLNTHRRTVIATANRFRLPTIFTDRIFVADGGLISYGVDRIDQYRQVATYIDRILRGGKLAELPVQLPTTFVLAVNLKTAKALELSIPATLLARADEVIE